MLKKLVMLNILSSLFITPIYAGDVSAVNKTSCGKLAGTTQPFILILDSGDDLHESITQCAKDAKLKGASISGLGQVAHPTLAYFSANPNEKPTFTAFSGHYELVSLNGNVANTNGNYYTHMHAGLADQKFRGIAGHVKSAKTGVTVEVTIVPFNAALERTVNPKTGFGPIVH